MEPVKLCARIESNPGTITKDDNNDKDTETIKHTSVRVQIICRET
jgi:hypothetical protein